MSKDVFILGWSQTDFARHWGREDKGLAAIMGAALEDVLEHARIPASAIQSAHVGNFMAELTNGQGQLGGVLASVDPALHGLPISRHEAACASGSMAVLAAMTEIEAGRYDCVLALGAEQERHLSGEQAAKHMAVAALAGEESEAATFCWPWMFEGLAGEYERRYGLNEAAMREIGKINFSNAKDNPRAQTRDWQFAEGSFDADDARNPLVEGRLRRNDCAGFTDGAAAVLLVSADKARELGADPERLPRILGWGHTTATLRQKDKLALSADEPLIFPHVAKAISDAQQRAGLPNTGLIDVIETHDCFTITEYMAIDHFGITAPGKSWQAIEDGRITRSGSIPINPGGGLMGQGHPVGATGIRMLADAARQVTGTAGAAQIDAAKRAQTLNLGGSATTIASFVVGY